AREPGGGLAAELDAGPDLAEPARLLEHDAAAARPRETEGGGESADAAPGDQEGSIGHGPNLPCGPSGPRRAPAGKAPSGEEALEATTDDGLGLGHDAVDELPDGGNVPDQAAHHAAAPGGRVHVAVLQDLAVLPAGDQVADVVDRGGRALLGLDPQDLVHR